MGLWNKVKRIATGVVTGGVSELYNTVKHYTYDKIEGANDDYQTEVDAAQAKLQAEQDAATEEAYAAIEEARKRRARMQGRQSTILAGALGDNSVSLNRKTLLGV